MVSYKLGILFLILLWASTSQARFVFEGQTDRFSFAQMYLGLEYSQINELTTADGVSRQSGSSVPRLSIGATHFWGWVDFYVSFPLARFEFESSQAGNFAEATFYSGVETGTRLYLLPLRDGRLSPFVGASWNAMHYQETYRNGLKGADHSVYRYPLQLGLSYTFYPFTLEIGSLQVQNQGFDYHTDSNGNKSEVLLPSQIYWASLKGSFETTKSVGKGSANGWGSPFIGIGPSSAWNTQLGTYETDYRPFLEYTKSTGKMYELAAGFEFEVTNTIFSVASRKINYEEKAFDYLVEFSRSSTAIEVTQILGDFVGFQPFLGPSYSREQLKLDELDPQLNTTSHSSEQWLMGIVYGWDIRPVEHSWWYLRTTLRHYPKVSMKLDSGHEVRFVNNEFNFIQFVFIPAYL